MENLKLDDIYFGKTDAYNEYISYGRNIFKDLFYPSASFQVDKFLKGEAYYIYGNKGTGKTMLLKYIETCVNEEPERNFTEFIRFKKDIDVDERNQIKRASLPNRPFEEVVEKLIPTDSSINSTLAWQIYMIKVIMNRLVETETGVFVRDENFEKLKTLINVLYKDKDKDIKRILPKIKRGNVELKLADLGKVQLELEWMDEGKTMVEFSSIAKKIISMYSNLHSMDCSVYVLIDELELSLNKNKDYERDVTLIRDLIFAIQYLNEIAKTKGYNVFLIAALRNEVYKSAKAKGTELNKSMNDFGIKISWIQKGGDINNHPLVQMIENRIKISENTKYGKSRDTIWNDYFVKEINEVSIKNYIINQTWFKPRDMIRLLTIMQEECGGRRFIDQSCFDAINQRYSDESWEEFSEELTAKYTLDEVEGIKQSLIGLGLPFSIEGYQKHAEAKRDLYSEVDALIAKRKLPHVLRDLYDIGVIGNYSKNPRFIFKGDRDIDPTKPLTIHYPLTRFFKTHFRNSKK